MQAVRAKPAKVIGSYVQDVIQVPIGQAPVAQAQAAEAQSPTGLRTGSRSFAYAGTTPYRAFAGLPASGLEATIGGIAAQMRLPVALSPSKNKDQVDFGLAETVLSDHETWSRKTEAETAARAERISMKTVVLAEAAERSSASGPKVKAVWKWLLRGGTWANYKHEESDTIEEHYQRFIAGDAESKRFTLLVAGKYRMTITFNQDYTNPGGTQRSDKGSREIRREMEAAEASRGSGSTAAATPAVTGRVDEVIVHYHFPDSGGKEVCQGFKTTAGGFDLYSKAYELSPQSLQQRGLIMHLTGPRGEVKLRDKELDEATWGFTLYVIGMERGKEYDIIVRGKS